MNNHLNLNRLIFTAFLLFFALFTQSNATVYYNRPCAVYSENLKYLVELIPFERHFDKGKGTVYKMNGSKKGDVFWSFDWYSPAYKIHLSNSGENIVKINTHSACSRRGVLIEFYNKYGLIKKYRRKKLLHYKNVITWGTAGCTWEAYSPCVSNYFGENDSLFTIVLADKSVYEFDVYSGMILKEYKDTCAMSHREYYRLKKVRGEKQGDRFLKRIPNLNIFKDKFTISNVYYSYKWHGTFIPKTNIGFNCSIRYETLIDTNSYEAQTVFTPKDFMNILISICQKPYIQNILDSHKNSSLRIHMSDSCFNESPVFFSKYIKALNQNGINSPEAKKWVEFCVDFNEEPYRASSFFHPIGTKYIFSNYSIRADSSIKKSCQELRHDILDSTTECLTFVDTLGHFGVLLYTPDKSKKIKENINEKFRRKKFEVYHPKIPWFSYSTGNLIKYFGKPDRIINAEDDDEKIWIYDNSYIKYVRVYKDDYLVSIETDKQK